MSNIQYSPQRYSFFLICANLFVVVQLIYRIVPLFTLFHLSIFRFPFFTGLFESPERGRELIAAQFVGIVVIKKIIVLYDLLSFN